MADEPHGRVTGTNADDHALTNCLGAAPVSTATPDSTPDHPTQRPSRTRLWLGAVVLVIVAGSLISVQALRPTPTQTAQDSGLAVGRAVGGDPGASSSRATSTGRPQLALGEMETTTTLPLPDPPPIDPYAPTPRIPLATLTIPRLNVAVTMFSGITLTAIDRGSGHWPGTPLPGDLGNMVVAGHRTLHAKPFARLDELKEGDKVIFDTVDGKRSTYAVRGTIIVPANNIGVASQHHAHTATLFACHPKGKATHRIVAKLRLLDEAGNPVDQDSALPPMDVGNRPTDSTLVIRKYDDQPQAGGDPFAGAQQ